MAAEAMSWIWQLTLLSVIEQRPCLLLALRTSSSLGAVSLSVTSGRRIWSGVACGQRVGDRVTDSSRGYATRPS
jgi:hypothetical protein